MATLQMCTRCGLLDDDPTEHYIAHGKYFVMKDGSLFFDPCDGQMIEA